ncbi:MAG: hypothetical protein BIFFINMI_00637 [Phycisphaerae bacterium]|nr:hypothetical protein [Phycisphaerae bacterium]
MKTHAAGERKNIVTGDGEYAVVVQGGKVVGRMGPRTCLQGGADLAVIVGTKAEIDAEIERSALDASSLLQPEPLDSQVQRALAQRDQIDAFLAKPEIAAVAEQVIAKRGIAVEGVVKQ